MKPGTTVIGHPQNERGGRKCSSSMVPSISDSFPSASNTEIIAMNAVGTFFEFAVATIQAKYGEDANQVNPVVLASIIQACAAVRASEELSNDLDALGLRLLDVACAIEQIGT